VLPFPVRRHRRDSLEPLPAGVRLITTKASRTAPDPPRSLVRLRLLAPPWRGFTFQGHFGGPVSSSFVFAIGRPIEANALAHDSCQQKIGS
jgi:hypothetical protein